MRVIMSSDICAFLMGVTVLNTYVLSSDCHCPSHLVLLVAGGLCGVPGGLLCLLPRLPQLLLELGHAPLQPRTDELQRLDLLAQDLVLAIKREEGLLL